MKEFLINLNLQLKDVLLVLGGAIVPILIQYFSGIGILRREGKHRIAEKIIEKKLEAYEDLMVIAKSIRKVQIYKGELINDFPIEEKYGTYRYPSLLDSLDIYKQWLKDTVQIYERNSEWLDNDITREFNYFQDYIMSVDRVVNNLKSPDNIRTLGCLLRQDFINISKKIEKLAFKFYSKKVFKMKFENKSKWHKYDKDLTHKRLKNSHLLKYSKFIESL